MKKRLVTWFHRKCYKRCLEDLQVQLNNIETQARETVSESPHRSCITDDMSSDPTLTDTEVTAGPEAAAEQERVREVSGAEFRESTTSHGGLRGTPRDESDAEPVVVEPRSAVNEVTAQPQTNVKHSPQPRAQPARTAVVR